MWPWKEQKASKVPGDLSYLVKSWSVGRSQLEISVEERWLCVLKNAFVVLV